MSTDASRVTIRVEVPAGITSAKVLLRLFAEKLGFPSYFGNNWNALFDCLCDFSWFTQPTRIVIRHYDVPALPSPDREAYLEVLTDAVGSWRAQPGLHQLEVEFPEEIQPF